MAFEKAFSFDVDEMIVLHIDLASKFDMLQESNATLTAYLQQDITDEKYGMNRPMRPALLICPGGAYQWCSPREGEPIALAFLPMGFNCFVLNYSVVPNTWPRALLEVAAAIELIYQNAQSWNIDKTKIAICGFSAGGHLAASYCTCRCFNEIKAYIDAKPVQAALLCYPVITAQEPICHMNSILNLNGAERLTEELVEKFSLEKHVVRGITPPTFLWHTAADQSVPVQNSILYAGALAREEIPFELHVFPRGEHGLATADRQTIADFTKMEHVSVNQWIPLAKVWLKDTLDI